jgi:hypothetical protein
MERHPMYDISSFETPACGGLLRMTTFCAASSKTLMVRSAALATRLEP